MRLIINSRGSSVAGLKRYNGEGMFSSIGRKLFLSGLKRVLNSLEKANHSQKIADAVVNGRQEVSDKKKVVTIPQVGVKRKSSVVSQLQPKAAKKYSNSTTNQLINRGSGIIWD